LVPFDDDFDRIRPVVGHRSFEVLVRISMGEHPADVIAPSDVRASEIVDSALKMIAGRIDAPQHHLISSMERPLSSPEGCLIVQ
jgi:hypothetical protein